MNLLGLSASLRAGSSSSALLVAAASFAPAGTAFTLYDDRLAGLPPFNPDLDGEGAVPPTPVAELRALLQAADGVLVASPEYAHGAPGVLKNALDWIVSSGELTNKPMALIAASPSGGRYAQSSLTPTLQVLGGQLVESVALVFTRRDVVGGLVVAPAILDRLAAVMASLCGAIAGNSARADDGSRSLP